MIDAETERLMLNWKRWRCSAPIGLAVSGAYDLEAPGRREEASMPLLNGEALEVDEAVHRLEAGLHMVVLEYWLRSETIPIKAVRCSMSVRTFYRRLDDAHAEIRVYLKQRAERRLHVQQQLGSGRAEAFRT